MIHEIAPDYIDNQYRRLFPEETSKVCFFRGNKAYVKKEGNRISWPVYEEVKEQAEDVTYLFEISGDRYFMAKCKEEFSLAGADWYDWKVLRDVEPKREAFAAMTAMHLYKWYESVQYCGRCGSKAVHDEKERMMRCPCCHNMMFPKISPAIIVAILHKGKILLTKYAEGARSYALVAGFVEIGETPEECVRREVLEEVGLHVKNIRYYNSQPWGYVGNLMLGYTAELDGENEIELDEEELALAKWMAPEEIPEIDDYSSLTREMIRRFRQGTL